MLNVIVTFFILSILAVLFGFGGLAAEFADVAKFLSLVFITLFIGSLLYSVITENEDSTI